MLEDLFLNPFYWIALTVVLVGGCLLVRARLLDFKFIALGFISQYVVHAYFAFGAGSEIFWFCAVFWALFVGVLTPQAQTIYRRGLENLRARGGAFERIDSFVVEADSQWRAQLAALEGTWVLVAKWFLLIYWTCRLAFYPYLGGELLLNERLEAGQDNRVLFFLGLAVLPALAACVAVWIRKGYRFRILDYVVLAVVTVGYLGTGSKAAILPIVLLLFGAISFFRKPLREMRLWIALAGAAGIVIVVRMFFFFPSAGPAELAQQMLYRLVANTDSLEYLKVIGQSPSDYPFSGFGALFPMMLKPFGLQYDYAPGVWLHGTRFGEWAGYGPNPGLVMDYFGNLGWFGLLVAVFAALYMLGWTRIGGAIGCSFVAITFQLFVDVTLFDIPFFFWAFVLVALVVLAAILRKPRINARVQSSLDRLPARLRPRPSAAEKSK